MERARRAAESPLRAILEAGKVRRRADGEPALDPDAAAPAPARPLVAPDTPVITIRTLPGGPAAPPAARQAAMTPGALAPVNGPPVPVPDLVRPVPALAPMSVAGPAQPAAPELRHMVEPETSPRILEQLNRPEVAVEFTIAPDGTVSDVQVQPPVPRVLATKIVEAIEQWRYAPVAAPRRHRVQLVFKPGG